MANFSWPRPPYLTQADREDNQFVIKETVILSRPAKLGAFVLDIIKSEGQVLQEDVLQKYEELCKDAEAEEGDGGLLAPYDDAVLLANHLSSIKATFLDDQLKEIRFHVQRMLEKYKSCVSAHDRRKHTKNSAQAPSNRRAMVQNLVESYRAGPPKAGNGIPWPTDLMKIMASYAYRLSTKNGKNSLYSRSFPFDVAYTELCHIKASATGAISATHDSADYLIFHGPLLKSSLKV